MRELAAHFPFELCVESEDRTPSDTGVQPNQSRLPRALPRTTLWKDKYFLQYNLSISSHNSPTDTTFEKNQNSAQVDTSSNNVPVRNNNKELSTFEEAKSHSLAVLCVVHLQTIHTTPVAACNLFPCREVQRLQPGGPNAGSRNPRTLKPGLAILQALPHGNPLNRKTISWQLRALFERVSLVPFET